MLACEPVCHALLQSCSFRFLHHCLHWRWQWALEVAFPRGWQLDHGCRETWFAFAACPKDIPLLNRDGSEAEQDCWVKSVVWGWGWENGCVHRVKKTTHHTISFHHANNHRLRVGEEKLKYLSVSVEFKSCISCTAVLSWFLGTLRNKDSFSCRAVILLP